MDNVETTDPITELVAFIEMLKGNRTSQEVFYIVLARSLSINLASPEMFDVLAAINNRLANMTRFITSVHDRHATDRTRPIARDALAMIAGPFSAQGISSQWENIIANQFNDKHLNALSTFANIAERHRPIRVINEDDRHNMVVQIDDLSREIVNDGEFPSWAKPILVDAFARLSFILEHLAYFGHEAALNELVLLQSRTVGLQASVITSSRNGNHSGVRTLFKTLEVITVIGHLFCLPAESVHAFETYERWISGPVTQESYIESLKLISAPIDRQSEDGNSAT